VFAQRGGQLPFDVAPLRALPYALGDDGRPADVASAKAGLAERLRDAQRATTDSPIFQLVENFPEIDHTKTDVFRERVEYSARMKERLRAARERGIEAVRAVEAELGDLGKQEAAVVIDLFLSYRAVKGWQEMIDLVPKISPALAQTVMVREQLALALNRAGRGAEAEHILRELIDKRGPSSETYGILGRVYKDRWEAAQKQGEVALADGLLDEAIEAYLRGFEADWRDAYPGVNAVTLMELHEPPDPRRRDLLPVVRYAVQRRIAAGRPDYWDHATVLELAVLAKREKEANDALKKALASVREGWELETTARNLRLIREARERRGSVEPWLPYIEGALEQRRHQLEQKAKAAGS
jgi:tetratricopeptide (TPR) repeat protein